MKTFAYFVLVVLMGGLVSAVLANSSNSTTEMQETILIKDSKPDGNQIGVKFDRDGRCIDCGNNGGNHQVIQQCTDCLNKGGFHNNHFYPYNFGGR